MKYRSRLLLTIPALSVALLLSACGEDSADDTAQQATGQSETAASRGAPVQSPTALTAEAICAALTPQDIAPLTDGDVTKQPEPKDDRGLPGCEWPVSDGYGSLEMDVFKPFDVSIILDSAVVRQFPVGDGTVYQQTKDDASTCRALVKTPDTPKGFVLRVRLDGQADASKLCESAIPQTEKVLKALGW
ncbi:DUF3558 family protein [Gordonia sp. SL306]|uniref:DUF3558 family protein n=1 Tax=Gordonia sp. SL306 TaxID=2995145 RepID=UPI00226E3C46|nr:DUF3558 family protein [Gordonia sp. SL306]WAC57575.1 DUF3558 family protein [Gordonia sp. SL306]